MKRSLLPAVPVAIIASSTTSVGVARGFNFAKQSARSRCFPFPTPKPSLLSPASRRPFRVGPIVAFVGTDGDGGEGGGLSSTAVSSAPPAVESTAAPPPTLDNDADDDADEVEAAARGALGITGSLPAPVNFGGVPYIDSSSLASNQAHRVVFVLGGPGAGKGTQSERIVDTYKCVHLSVGDLLRKGAERSDYPHAEQVKECLVQGNIVPVALSLGLLRIAMDEKAAEEDMGYGSRIFLVDGFPRNYDNVQGWMEHMPSYTAVLGALVYNCPMEVLERRIMARAKTSGRSDDNLDSARRRFDTFRSQTEPVVRALERVEDLQAEENDGGSRLRIVNIDATGTVEDVWKATEAAMNEYVKNDVLTANDNLLKAIEEGDVKKIADLCDGKLELDPSHERASKSTISNAKVDILNGTRAVVSYDIEVKKDLNVRETREWRHGPKGWMCDDVTRKE